MRILEKSARVAAIALAVLVIALSLCGAVGAWFVNRQGHRCRTERVWRDRDRRRGGRCRGGAGGRPDRERAGRKCGRPPRPSPTVGAQAQANSPVLNALNERLETSLAPRIAQMQQALAPVRDALGSVGNAVSLLNSLPMLADRAPRLAALDETFTRLEELSADTTQLRAHAAARWRSRRANVAAETVAALNGLTQRIDTRLGEVQENVQELREEVARVVSSGWTSASRGCFSCST